MSDEPTQEDVWRALKGEQPIASWRCRWLHIHRWTKWQCPTGPTDDGQAYKFRLFRYCADCNIPQSTIKIFTKK